MTCGLEPSPRCCYLQPQLVELALPQHDAFSDGAQHDDCSVGGQQLELLVVEDAAVCLGLLVSMVISFMLAIWST